MVRKIKVLQIGQVNQMPATLPLGMQWEWLSFAQLAHATPQAVKAQFPKKFEIVLIELTNEVIDWHLLDSVVEPYRVFYWHTKEEEAFSIPLANWLKSKMAKSFELAELDERLNVWSKTLFAKQAYGAGIDLRSIVVNPTLQSQTRYEGNHYVCVSAQSPKFLPLLSWSRNLSVNANEPLEIWLKHEVEGTCELRLKCVKFYRGATTQVIESEYLYLTSPQMPLIIASDSDLTIALSLEMKGQAMVKVGKLHYRESRLDLGVFLPGGKKVSDSVGDEIIYYFHPGDLKPPLNVYFSGYRSLEGFEGYFMMEQLGTPFLLIGDPRLEGGAFYMGTPEYERLMLEIIRKHLDYLGFTSQQLVLSGLSMGTYGALYYGAQLEPAAIIVGKPLANIGSIALNGMLTRPTEFYTGFDVVYALTQEMTKASAERLNQRFWEVFERADFDQTLFAIAYMEQDDYDTTAYYDVLERLADSRAQVRSKGFVGRHNDDSAGIFDWFYKQYQLILQDKFKR